MRIVWSTEERRALLDGFCNLLRANPFVLSPAWVRQNFTAAQSLIVPSRRRQYPSPAELAAMYDTLRATAYTMVQTEALDTERILTENSALEQRARAAEAELAALNKRLADYEQKAGRSVFSILDAAVKGYQKPVEKVFVSAPAVVHRRRVVVAGVHDKHRQAIERDFPGFEIHWLEQRANDSAVKSKCSGQPVVVCTHGVNGNVLNLARNVSSQCVAVNGVSGVTRALQQLGAH